MKKIRIKLKENPYDVLIGNGIINSLRREAEKRNINTDFFSVIDGNVNRKYKATVKELVKNNSRYIFNAAEKNKSFETLQTIHKKILKGKLGRTSTVLALGGGIVGDVTGFAASTYMRGIKYVQVPTTLLAAVDSSVGGKTGINFYETKNVIGSFYQPQLVVIDTDFFKTLPDDEIMCGMGELVKYAFIIDKQFYKYLDKNLEKVLNLDQDVIKKVVAVSVKYKGSVVINDEKESDLRKVLNFGHTFAHALEVEQEYKIKHGQAVIAGISCALHLSYKLGLIDFKTLNKHVKFIEQFKSKIKIRQFDKRRLYSIMQRDKKNKDGKIKFVLIKDIGELLLDVEAEKDDVYFGLDKGLGIFSK